MVLEFLPVDVPSHVAAAAHSRLTTLRIQHDNAALMHLSGVMAEHLGTTADAVLDVLETLPANLLTFAYSAQGLTALTDGVGSMLGLDDRPPLIAAIH